MQQLGPRPLAKEHACMRNHFRPISFSDISIACWVLGGVNGNLTLVTDRNEQTGRSSVAC
jgi:hypothetical protein